MVMDGHDGEKAADFARLHIPGQLLQQRIVGGPEAVRECIVDAFKITERQFFMALDDALTRKLSLQSEINVSKCVSRYVFPARLPTSVAMVTLVCPVKMACL